MFKVGDVVSVKGSPSLKGVVLNIIKHQTFYDYLVKTEMFTKWYPGESLKLSDTEVKTESEFKVGDEIVITKDTDTVMSIIKKGTKGKIIREKNSLGYYTILLRNGNTYDLRGCFELAEPPELTISKTETVTTDSTKFDIHRDICDTLNTLYRAKNADYGDSFANTRKVVSNAILVRLNDKISRLNSLMSGNKQQVKDESIKDTLMDLANYAILELVEMECEK